LIGSTIKKKNCEAQSQTNQTLKDEIRKKKKKSHMKIQNKKISIKITRIKTKIKNKLKGNYNFFIRE